MKAKLREKYLPMSHRKEEPLIHQFEPHRTSTPRYKSNPRPIFLSQPNPTAPCVYKKQPFPTTLVFPNSQPTTVSHSPNQSQVLDQFSLANPSLQSHVFTITNPFLPPHLFTRANPSLPSRLLPRVNPLLVSYLSSPILLSQVFDPPQLLSLPLLS